MSAYGNRADFAPLPVRPSVAGGLGAVAVAATHTEASVGQNRDRSDYASATLEGLHCSNEQDVLVNEILTRVARKDAPRAAIAELEGLDDKFTLGHTYGMAKFALHLAIQMGISGKRLELLAEGCLVHDWGKAEAQAAIYTRGGLSEPDKAAIRNHPAAGLRRLSTHNVSNVVRGITAFHHKYKRDRAACYGPGEQSVPLEERDVALEKITAIADVYDSARSSRPYDPTMLSVEDAVARVSDELDVTNDDLQALRVLVGVAA